MHCVCRSSDHAGLAGRAFGPLSPPVITHCRSYSSQFLIGSGPSKGSAEMNRTRAGIFASSGSSVFDTVLNLNGCARPDILRPITDPRGQPKRVVGAIRQQQPIEIWSCFYQRTQPMPPRYKFFSVFEKICHRCAEDSFTNTFLSRKSVPLSWLFPMRV